MTRHIDYYFSLQSPWAYIGNRLFHEVAARHGVKINYKPMVLTEVFAESGGLPLKQRHPVRQRYRMVELQRWRERRNKSFHLTPAHWPFDARLGDGMIIAIAEAGHDPQDFVAQGFKGVWEDQQDLGNPATLIAIADSVGLAGKDLVARAGSSEIGAIYSRNRDEALAADVFGAPAYVLDGEVFWGQDRIELLDDALGSGRAPFRPNL